MADAIVGTSYVPIGRRALAKHLLGLAPRLVEATLAAEFDPSVGHQVGDDMVAAHFTGVETLSKTLALIAEELPKLLDSPPPDINVTAGLLSWSAAWQPAMPVPYVTHHWPCPALGPSGAEVAGRYLRLVRSLEAYRASLPLPRFD